MLRSITAFGAVFIHAIAWSATDVGVTVINTPQSGCGLGTAEVVQVQIYNFGDPLTLTSIPVSYTVNGGTAITEVAFYPSFATGETKVYTFTVTTNLSAFGTYAINAFTSLVGDANASNNGVIKTVFNYAPSNGGDMEPSTTVCAGSNSVTLSSTGVVGSVLRWEYSTDGGANWFNIANTTTSLTVTNLTVTTAYRLLAQNGTCSSDYSDVATITVDAAPVGGSLGTSQSVCTADNYTVLELTGYSGTITKWQTNTGSGWMDLAHTADTLEVTDLTVTTSYRVFVANGVCAPATSTVATLTVVANPVGGTLQSSGAFCQSASDTLKLVSYSGNIIKWQYNDGSGWVDVSNTDDTLIYTNVTQTTQYRVIVGNGVCPDVTSDTATITISASADAGTLFEDKNECASGNYDVLILNSYSGTIEKWQYNEGSGWVDIANTDDQLVYSNLTVTTLYRVIVTSGACAVDTSNTVTVNVSPATVGGTIAGSDTVCTGGSGTLTLSGHVGNIVRWEVSEDNGASWTYAISPDSTYDYTNLTETTLFRVRVRSGACPPRYSDTAVVAVDPLAVGGSINGSGAVCYGSNSGTLELVSYTGDVVKWQSNSGSGWTDINTAADTLNYNNLTADTDYRVIVSSGACANDTSDVATITITPNTVPGTLQATPAVVCAGSNQGTIMLSGSIGEVVKWEYSTDGGLNWVTATTTDTFLLFVNLVETTSYRVAVQNSPCPMAYSNVVTVIVNEPSAGGELLSSQSVCISGNGGTLQLVNYNGTITAWQKNEGFGWLDEVNSGPSLTFTNLTQTTSYRAIVKSGACPPDTSTVATITVAPLAVAGTLSGSDSVCSGNNSGTVILAGSSGTLRWEYSQDSAIWIQMASTDTLITYNNILTTTYYRAILSSNPCPEDTSNVAVISIDAPAATGTLHDPDTVCSTGNSGTLFITGTIGDIARWEYTTNGGVSWNNITNVTAAQPYGDLTQTTWYRVLVTSGACAAAYSNIVVITVLQPPVPGTISGSTTVCTGSNSGTLTLTGHSGTITKWQGNTGSGWYDIALTGPSLAYNNLTQTTSYRVVVGNGVCGDTISGVATITVSPATNGGVLSGADTVCSTGNSGWLTLTGQVGAVQSWQASTDGGNSWTNITSTNTVLLYNNLTQTTLYRVVVKSGACPVAYSNAVQITVLTPPVGGFISGPTTGCSGSNAGTLVLSGYSGSILKWQYNSGSGWENIIHTQNTLSYSNLTVTTNYRVVVGNNVCANDTSAVIMITVYPLPDAAITPSGSTTICDGDTIVLQVPATLTYLWSTGATTQAISVALSGTYSVTVTDGNGCSNQSQPVTVTVNNAPAPVITANGPTAFCEGASVVLTASAADSYSWSTGATTQSITVDTSGTFTVTVTNTDHCLGIGTSTPTVVTVHPNPHAGFSTSASGGTVQFTNASSGGTSYLWDFGDGQLSVLNNPSNTYASSGNYVVCLTATSANGCEDSTCQTLSVFVGVESMEPLVSSLTVMPNPASDHAVVSFALPQAGHFSIVLCDDLGRELVQVADARLAAGLHEFTVDLAQMNQGSYLIAIRRAEGVAYARVMVVR